MSAIKYAIDEIMFNIPNKLLTLAYMRKPGYFGIETTIEKQITDLVIKRKVLRDCNMISGVNLRIDINNCIIKEYQKNLNETNYVIVVPMSITNRRRVLEPLSLTSNSGTHMYNITDNPVYNAASNILNNNSIGNNIVITNLELIAVNTILVHDNVNFLGPNTYLNVLIEHDENLSKLSPRTYGVFAELCLEATKYDIYRELVEELDKGIVYNGFELGHLSELIMEYKDSYEKYNEILKEKWAKIIFANDDVNLSEFIEGMISPNI